MGVDRASLELSGPGGAGAQHDVRTPTTDETSFVEYLSACLADRYVIERELGKGGMATVYLANDRKHERKVALKILRPDIASVLGSERFEQEIKIAAGMSHPNIMPVHDSGTAGGLLYYVMPNVDGMSLRDRLDRDGTVPVTEALRIVRAVASALDYAHRHGVVHRDVKPENIMFCDGLPVVADFGIGKAMSTVGNAGLTLSGVAVGTPAYMSPEQAAGDENVDGRSDIFSIGCVLFEMLTGRQPFTGPTAQIVIAKRFVEQPEDVAELSGQAGPEVAQLVQHAMAREPSDRFENGSALVTAIDELLRTEPHHSAPLAVQPRSKAAVANDGVRRETEPAPLGARRSRDVAARSWDGEERRGRAISPYANVVRGGIVFGLAAVGVLSIVHYTVEWLGLSDWVFSGAVLWLLAGIPLVTVTGRQEYKRAARRASAAHLTTAVGITRHFTWRKAFLGGGAALAGLGVVTAAHFVMRVEGIGPFGTLLATGDIENGGRIIVAEFTNRTGNADLAAAVTEALRVDLTQSHVVTVVSQTEVLEALGRLNLPPSTKVDGRVALQLAGADEAAAVVTGEVLSSGQGFVLTASIINSADGQELLALRETAADESRVFAAVERLSHRLRERIGESLKDIRRSHPMSSAQAVSST